MQPGQFTPSSGKFCANKACNKCNARENVQLVPSTGKQVIPARCRKRLRIVKGGKRSLLYQAQSNVQPLPNTEKRQNSCEARKTIAKAAKRGKEL